MHSDYDRDIDPDTDSDPEDWLILPRCAGEGKATPFRCRSLLLTSAPVFMTPVLDPHKPLCSNDRVRHGRILALDYGSKNVGLAASDELGIVVRPLRSVPNCGRRDLLNRLKAIVRENSIDSLLVGLPLNMDGSSGEAAERLRRFEAFLRQEIDLPLREFDERLSTVEANEMWRSMNARRQRRYRTVDSLAAAFILERFLRET